MGDCALLLYSMVQYSTIQYSMLQYTTLHYMRLIKGIIIILILKNLPSVLGLDLECTVKDSAFPKRWPWWPREASQF